MAGYGVGWLTRINAAPMLWGPLSDRFGRRPIFLGCLTVLIGSCIGLALCPTNAFWLLIVLRLLQAGGCASMIAVGEFSRLHKFPVSGKLC